MPPASPIIDTNITLGQWPMRRVACDRLDTLTEKLRAANVTHAWAGHYDGLFHTNLIEVNNRLAAACNRVARPEAAEGRGGLQLIPFASINPTAPNWESELDRCLTLHKIPGIRLHPNYHNYKLDHSGFARLLAAATERKLIVQFAVLMEDARMMHPLMRVPPVDIGPLEKLVSQTPGLRLVLLNATASAIRTDKLYRLTSAGEVYVEIAMLETLAALETLVKDIPASRILFGSHAPSFYFEAAALKLQESNLPITHLAAITRENARRLLPTSA
jgi:predicted TIM-barrel fold metal-dependent hydrolase